MLQALHSTASSFFMKILLFALVASFALWGIGDIFRTTPADAIITVGDEVITVQELRMEYDQERSRFQQMLGSGFSEDMLQSLNIPRQVMNRLVERALLREEARNQGFIVSEAMLMDELRNNPMFAGEDGRFDAERFRSILMSNRITERQYFSMLNEEIGTEMLQNAVSHEMPWPQQVTELAFRRNAEERVADLLFFPLGIIKNVAEPSAEELETFYQDRAPSFQTQEFRTISMLTIDPQALADSYDVPEEELLIEYKNRSDAYSLPEQRDVQQLLFAEKSQAEEARAAIENGTDFAATGKAFDATNDEINLGLVSRGGIISEAEDAVFGLEKGGVSQPVESAFGWHLFKVNAIEEAHTQPLAEVRDALADDLSYQWSQTEAYERSNQLADELAMGASMEDAAKLLGMKIQTIGPVSIQGQTPNGDNVTLNDSTPRLLPTAYQMQSGQLSTLQEGENGVYYVVRVDEITSPRVRPLAEVRSEVVQQWKAEKKREQLDALVQGVAERLASQNVAEVAKSTGAILHNDVTLKRTDDAFGTGDNQTALPGALVHALFAMEQPGEVTQAIASPEGGYMLAKLETIKEVDTQAANDELVALADEVAASVEGELFRDYLFHLRQKYDVPEVSDERLRSIVAVE